MKRTISKLTRPLLLALAVAVTGPGCDKDADEWIPVQFDRNEDQTEQTDPDDASRTKKRSKTKRAKKKRTAKPKNEPKPHDARAARSIESGSVSFLRTRSKAIHQTLLGALPKADEKELRDVPFVTARGQEVNAFAACMRGSAVIGVTEGLMQVQSQLARARATDEVFGTKKLDAYLLQLSRSRKLMPPAGFIPARMDEHEGKRSRQAVLLDEGLAFVIGHELAHHRLHHTGCIGHDAEHGVTTADVGRVLAKRVPMFNQPNELASDVYGIENVLRAGRDADTGWTEGGALLMLKAFRARTRMPLADALVFGFERTHPHPDVRIPVVEQTATTWRLSGGRSLPRLPNIVLGG